VHVAEKQWICFRVQVFNFYSWIFLFMFFFPSVRSDTVPGFAIGACCGLLLLVFLLVQKPVLANRKRKKHRRRVAEPRVKIPLLLIRLVSILGPFVGGFVTNLLLVSLVWLLLSPNAGITAGFSKWIIPVFFFASGVFWVVFHKIFGYENELIRSVFAIVSMSIQFVVLLASVVLSGHTTEFISTWNLLVAVCLFHSVESNLVNRNQISHVLELFGLALGSVSVVMLASFVQDATQLSHTLALICLVVKLVFAVIIALELFFVSSRRQEMSSFCVKYSRNQVQKKIGKKKLVLTINERLQLKLPACCWLKLGD
jgi:hypothetical protein